MANPNCDGGRCISDTGEVRVYPIGGSSNLILCNYCFNYENRYNAQRGKETGKPEWFPQRDWFKCETYPKD